MADPESQPKTEMKTIGISSFSISFGDLSNLEALVNQADEGLKANGINVEHMTEIKKIIKKVRSTKS